MNGVIPEIGATVSAVIACDIVKVVARFKTGTDEGFAAPEASKNTTTSDAMVPLHIHDISSSAAAIILLAPLVLGVILGPLAERYFLTSLANYNNDLTIFFTRPISASILAFAAVFVSWALVPELLKQLRKLRRDVDRTA